MSLLLSLAVMILSTLIGAIAALYLKKGSARFSLHPIKLLKNKHIVIGGSLYVFGVMLYLFVLRELPLSVAYPLSSMQYIWITLISKRYLRERVDAWRWAGVSLILLGIIILTV
jgi:drug/metabolite transporter (DMT)-like permease